MMLKEIGAGMAIYYREDGKMVAREIAKVESPSMNTTKSVDKTHIIHDPEGIFPEFAIADRVLKATNSFDAYLDREYVEYLPEGDGIHWLHNGRCKSLKSWERGDK